MNRSKSQCLNCKKKKKSKIIILLVLFILVYNRTTLFLLFFRKREQQLCVLAHKHTIEWMMSEKITPAINNKYICGFSKKREFNLFKLKFKNKLIIMVFL